MIKIVTVPVSLASALAGRHQYKSVEDAWTCILDKKKCDVSQPLISNFLGTETVENHEISSKLRGPVFGRVKRAYDKYGYDRMDVVKEQVSTSIIPNIAQIVSEKVHTVKDSISASADKAETIRELICKHDLEDKFSDDIDTLDAQSDDEMHNTGRRVVDAVQEVIANNTIKIASDCIESGVNCLRGTTFEKPVIHFIRDIAQEVKGIELGGRISICRFIPADYAIDCNYRGAKTLDECKTKFPECNAFINLMGKTDDTLFSTRTKQCKFIVEVKNRMNRFFEPSYDIDQVALYAIGSEATKGGILIQKYNKRIKHNVYHNEQLIYRWMQVVQGIQKTVMRAVSKGVL
jgi:hypothetical protein